MARISAARRPPKGMLGRWRIVAMDGWDRDAIDLVGPGYIEFRRNGTGEFAIIAVQGEMYCRPEQHGGTDGVGFTWEGDDDGHPVSGRGWAVTAAGDELNGRLYFHHGDESGFRAIPFTKAPQEGRP
ncbi:hypothetical protein [Nocardia sp. NBC_01388]|uniref:hypothetical protein n=1 Tax=Nocardia sp. NBC_01388 TaxID=2903596 RepID=UPI00325245F8